MTGSRGDKDLGSSRGQHRWCQHMAVPVIMAVLGSAVLQPARFAGSALASPRPSQGAGPWRAAATSTARIAHDRLPMSFEVNRGQVDHRVAFLAHGPGSTLFLTPTSAVLSLQSQPSAKGMSPDLRSSIRHPSRSRPGQLRGHRAVLRMNFLHANVDPKIVGLQELPGKVNYFLGNNPHKWHPNIPTYARVEYQNVYPGINLVYYGAQGHLEYDWILRPGSNPARIQLRIDGGRRLHVDRGGNLSLTTGVGSLIESRPRIYQSVAGVRRVIFGHYTVDGPGQVGIRLGAYDHRHRLIIDPQLIYSTYLGGNASVSGNGIAVDSSGAAYVTGLVSPGTFPTTPGAFQTSYGGNSNSYAFVTKLNPNGSALLYSAYLGGNGTGDLGSGIAVDSSGDAYVTGLTTSRNFPTTPGALKTTGVYNAFVTKLSPDGAQLLYSTYLGGSNGTDSGLHDFGNGIALDSVGDAYVTGQTNSATFPITSGAFQTTCGGGYDAFVAKLNPDGSGLLYSTYLGGSGGDSGNGIALDGSGDAYVTGGTSSANFPTTSGTFQATYGGGGDAFMTKLNPTGSGLLYSTYLGGNGGDGGASIAVDIPGDAYVTGRAGSGNFPTTPGAFQTNYFSGYGNAFVSKLNPSGTALLYSTYLGGSGDDFGNAIALDSSGDAYVAGRANSGDFPTTPGAFQTIFAGGAADAFVSKLNPGGTALLYSTYLGGNYQEFGNGIALDSAGSVYLTGGTGSSNFPTTSGAFQTTNGGHDLTFNTFITKLNLGSTSGAQSPIGNPVPPVENPTPNPSEPQVPASHPKCQPVVFPDGTPKVVELIVQGVNEDNPGSQGPTRPDGSYDPTSVGPVGYCYGPNGQTNPDLNPAVQSVYEHWKPEPSQQGHQRMLDMMGAFGAVIVPFSYNGASAFYDYPNRTPTFEVNPYSRYDPGNDPPMASVAVLHNEIHSIHKYWPKSRIILFGHSLGGLIAQLWWSKHYRDWPDHYGVSGVASLDSPISGVQNGSFCVAGVVAVTACELGGGVGPDVGLWFANTWDDRANVDQAILNADTDASYTAIGTAGDPVYTTGDFAFSSEGLYSQLVFADGCSASFFTKAFVRCTPARNDYLDSCHGRGHAWQSGDHSLVKNCPDVVDKFRPSLRQSLNIVSTQSLTLRSRQAVKSGNTVPVAYGILSPSVLWTGAKAVIRGAGLGSRPGIVRFVSSRKGHMATARIINWNSRRVTVIVPRHATTGLVDLMPKGSTTGLQVGEATILGAANRVAYLTAFEESPTPLQGQRATITVVAHGKRGNRLPGVRVTLVDGIASEHANTNATGAIRISVLSYRSKSAMIYSGRAFKQIGIRWNKAPSMSAKASRSSSSIQVHAPVTIAVKLIGASGHPVANQMVTFYGMGSQSLKLGSKQATTNQAGLAEITATDGVAETFIVGFAADAFSKSGFVEVHAHL